MNDSNANQLEIANRGEWIPEKAQIVRSIATIYLESGNYREVLSTNEDLLPLQRILKDRKGEAGCLNNIGLAYANLARRDQALKFYQQALAIDVEDSGLEGWNHNSQQYR